MYCKWNNILQYLYFVPPLVVTPEYILYLSSLYTLNHLLIPTVSHSVSFFSRHLLLVFIFLFHFFLLSPYFTSSSLYCLHLLFYSPCPLFLPLFPLPSDLFPLSSFSPLFRFLILLLLVFAFLSSILFICHTLLPLFLSCPFSSLLPSLCLLPCFSLCFYSSFYSPLPPYPCFLPLLSLSFLPSALFISSPSIIFPSLFCPLFLYFCSLFIFQIAPCFLFLYCIPSVLFSFFF